MEIINLFRIMEGKNKGKFIDLDELPQSDVMSGTATLII